MRRALLFLMSVGLIFTIATGSVRADEPKPPKGFTAIFNGTDLTGWHGWNIHAGKSGPLDLEKMSPEDRAKKIEEWTADSAKHWSVQNGELVNDGHGAYLATDKNYGDGG